MASSPAAAYLLGHVRRKSYSATKNVGEDVAVALAATDLPSAVFVTLDKAAAFMALAELGPRRVSTPLDVWADLHARKLITKAHFDDLMDRTIKSSSLPGIPRRF